MNRSELECFIGVCKRYDYPFFVSLVDNISLMPYQNFVTNYNSALTTAEIKSIYYLQKLFGNNYDYGFNKIYFGYRIMTGGEAPKSGLDLNKLSNLASQLAKAGKDLINVGQKVVKSEQAKKIVASTVNFLIQNTDSAVNFIQKSVEIPFGVLLSKIKDENLRNKVQLSYNKTFALVKEIINMYKEIYKTQKFPVNRVIGIVSQALDIVLELIPDETAKGVLRDSFSIVLPELKNQLQNMEEKKLPPN